MMRDSRPQRQARSRVTYKESDDDDDDFVPTTTMGKPGGVAKGKRTLTLKRARTTLEPPVSLAKEDVDSDEDVYALTVEEKSAPVQFPQFFESAPELLNCDIRQSSAFEFLLEAVSDASGDGEEEGGCSSAQKSPSHSGSKLKVKKEKTTSAAYGPELLAAYSAFERKLQAVKGVKEEDAVKKSTDEETTLILGTKDIKGEENEKSSGDEKKYVRRGERVNMPASKTESKLDDVESYKKVSGTGEQDKPYNMSSTDDDEGNADADDSWNESSDASDTEKKQEASVTVAAPHSTINQDVKNINLATSDPSAAERVVMHAKVASAPASLPKKRPALWGSTKPFVPPGPKTLQTPTAHRRVVGLSRRHRPPPLHPYLLES